MFFYFLCNNELQIRVQIAKLNLFYVFSFVFSWVLETNCLIYQMWSTQKQQFAENLCIKWYNCMRKSSHTFLVRRRNSASSKVNITNCISSRLMQLSILGAPMSSSGDHFAQIEKTLPYSSGAHEIEIILRWSPHDFILNISYSNHVIILSVSNIPMVYLVNKWLWRKSKKKMILTNE